MNNLQAEELIQLIEDQSDLQRWRVVEKASVKEMILALQRATSSTTRHALCYRLGKRHAKSAVPLLITMLDDPSSNVQSSAADALGTIGDPRAGSALLAHLEREDVEIEVRRMIGAVMGAVKCEAAIPILIRLLSHEDADLHGNVAWSLGLLGAEEAIKPLQEALLHETNNWSKNNIKEALQRINSIVHTNLDHNKRI